LLTNLPPAPGGYESTISLSVLIKFIGHPVYFYKLNLAASIAASIKIKKIPSLYLVNGVIIESAESNIKWDYPLFMANKKHYP